MLKKPFLANEFFGANGTVFPAYFVVAAAVRTIRSWPSVSCQCTFWVRFLRRDTMAMAWATL